MRPMQMSVSVPPTDAERVLGRFDAAVVIVEYGDYASALARSG